MYTQPRCYTNEKPLNLKTLLRFWSVGVEKAGQEAGEDLCKGAAVSESGWGRGPLELAVLLRGSRVPVLRCQS